MAEFALIDLIAARCALAREDVWLGIGDDGAVLAPPPGMHLVVATDTLVSGVHFPPATAPADIGWKALAVNLSDLAAMGATPAWASLALTLPTADRDFVAGFADGFAELARAHRVALIGGDTTRGPLAITLTVHGFVEPGCALRRDGALVGDGVYVTGTLGDAAAGLRCIDADFEPGLAPTTRAELLHRLNRPQPRIVAGIALRGRASACIDVSDGLIADLAHVARCSAVGMEIDVDALPASAALQSLADASARTQLQLAGGDDYELAFTMPAAHAAVLQEIATRDEFVFTCIGRVVEGAGVRLHDAHGNPIETPQRGWEHFA